MEQVIPQYRHSHHTFHIPVMGLGFSIDTPLKVARFGISSAISIMEDHLVEKMREIHCSRWERKYTHIAVSEDDSRARRITAYLDLMDEIISSQMAVLRTESFDEGSDITKYFEMLPASSPLKALYVKMINTLGAEEKTILQNTLRNMLVPGSVDVNIMTKLDKVNHAPDGTELGPEYTDASSALRGFANSKLRSAIIFSAGLNPRLFSYCSTFDDFFPDQQGILRKKIILKVSDYRSAVIQGKFLAKKGLWVSEFRIESGLNCGGHAFATDGLLMGPILEEFKLKRKELYNEILSICNNALVQDGRYGFQSPPQVKITAQGGLGTSQEHQFLIDYYNLDSTGWGSPFLLVPEVTNVEDDTLSKLSTAKPEDYYLSNASPLGVPFNNFRYSSSEEQRLLRIAKGRPGSPCYKKFLAFNTEFGPKPICTASRLYQDLKIREVREKIQNEEQLTDEINKIMEKDCLCEGLGAPALLKNNIEPGHKLKAVTICPGPNLAYFSGIHSMPAMIGHIYGKKNLLNLVLRNHMFINEMFLNISYLKDECKKHFRDLTPKKTAQLNLFKENLLKGVDYYKSLLPSPLLFEDGQLKQFLSKLMEAKNIIFNINFSYNSNGFTQAE